MRVAGIAVDIPSSGRPAARLVVASDATGAPAVELVGDFTGDDVALPVQLHDAAEALRSRLEGLAVDRVVLRRADRPPRATNAEGPKLRLLMEGALTSAARSVVVDTRLGTGRDTGTWFGAGKAGVDAAAEALLQAWSLHARYRDAASAALAALALGP
jgi:hypothetical protein